MKCNLCKIKMTEEDSQVSSDRDGLCCRCFEEVYAEEISYCDGVCDR